MNMEMGMKHACTALCIDIKSAVLVLRKKDSFRDANG